MNVLGVIMARGGSVGLKDKHVLPLLGRPVISYTLDHAAQARRLKRVTVSTDIPAVRALGLSHGFDIVQRPAHLATSDASVQDVMLDAMDAIESRDPSFHADALVVLYGNVPVRGEGVIDRAIELLERSGCDSVRSFCPVGKWHPAWMARINGDRVELLQPNSIHRRQDLESFYLHDGAVVAVSRSSMTRGRDKPEDPHAFFGIDRRAIFTQTGETIEIDQQRDLYWAEAALRESQGDIARRRVI